jgi:hypothetical protein
MVGCPMDGTRVDRRGLHEAGEWTPGETEVLARAVIRAPSVHNTQPWKVELPGGEALVFRRDDVVLPHDEPVGRDRAISCGAAVANLALAVSVLGLAPEVTVLPDPGRPELMARVRAGARKAPSDVDLHRFSAISRRNCYRHPFSARVVSEHQVRDLVEAASVDGIRVRPIRDRGELSEVADLLEYAGDVLRNDQRYQRDLGLWTTGNGHPRHRGMYRRAGTTPWAGLVPVTTAVPDRAVLARRLEHETFLLFGTPGDERGDHLRAGMAMEETWLAAVDAGLVASVTTHPLHLPEVRAGLVGGLGFTGCPQILMRVGHASGTQWTN